MLPIKDYTLVVSEINICITYICVWAEKLFLYQIFINYGYNKL